MNKKTILIVPGQPKSIFFEIFFKTLKKNKFKSPLLLICCKYQLINQMKIFKFKKRLKILTPKSFEYSKINNKTINLIDVKFSNNSKNLINESTNNYINKTFEVAFKLINKKLSYKLINGPINKSFFLRKKFLGVTEFISNKFKKKNKGMLIFNKKLSVCPVTTHLPLKQVAGKINKKIIKEKILLVEKYYIKNFQLKPKIAVTGLNPHCESVLKLNEDEKIIKPAIMEMKAKKINVHGPFSADTIFIKKNRRKYNVIIGMYHDQVLTPIKTLFEYKAINTTMGLPFLRVTPDHGPNEKMIGKNKSNPSSLIEALKFLDQR